MKLTDNYGMLYKTTKASFRLSAIGNTANKVIKTVHNTIQKGFLNLHRTYILLYGYFKLLSSCGVYS
jgi:hypothetical protein